MAALVDDVSGRGPAYILQAFTHQLLKNTHVIEPKLIFFAGGVAQPTPEQLNLFFPSWSTSHIDKNKQQLIEKKRNELLKDFFANNYRVTMGEF